MRVALLFLLLILPGLLTAQEAVSDSTGDPKTQRYHYIKGYPDHFFVWPVLKQRRLDFEMRSLTGDRRIVEYKANKPYSLGIGFYLFELGVELAFAIPVDERSRRLYGESDSRDIQLNVMSRRWGVDLFHQQYEGFYLDDLENPVPANTPYPQRGDIHTGNTGLSVNYTFNYNRFSFRSAYNFAERQLRSAGSPVAFAAVRTFYVTADSAFLGDAFVPDFGAAAGISQFRSTIFGVAPGYTYSVIFRGFFLNGMLALGPARNWMTYQLGQDGANRDIRMSTYVAARIALGYNGDRIFGGMMFMNQGVNARTADMQLTSSNSSFKILVGYRFDERGVLRKRVADIPKEIF